MAGMFDVDSPIMSVLNKITNVVILNFCFLVSCIPLVTIGAGLTALYSVHLKMVKDEESYVFRSYWQAFKDNFKISTLCWLILLAVGGIFFLDYRAIRIIGGMAGTVMGGLLLAMLLCYMILFLNVFPYIARFADNLWVSMKNAFVIGMVNIGYTITVALITAALVGISVYSLAFFLRALFLWLFFGVSLVVYLHCFFFRRVLDKYIDSNQETSK